jgi:hypothetical protein
MLGGRIPDVRSRWRSVVVHAFVPLPRRLRTRAVLATRAARPMVPSFSLISTFFPSQALTASPSACPSPRAPAATGAAPDFGDA